MILGDGPLHGELLRQRAQLQLESDVIFPGFVQYDQLPLYYGLAGAFVHASTVEQWGLVVNEALASALPVLVSTDAVAYLNSSMTAKTASRSILWTSVSCRDCLIRW